jgi:hypothetical protein
MITQRADARFSNRRFKKGKNKSKCTAVPDVPHLIRSIQRLDGDPDCFGKTVSDCSRACPWRDYCPSAAKKGWAVKPNGRRVKDE